MNRPDISRLKKNRAIYLKLGLLGALAFAIFAFNWTTDWYGPISNKDYVPEVMEEIQMVRTVHQEERRLPPPVVEPTVELKVKDLEFIVEKPEPKKIEKLINDKLSKVKTPRPVPLPKPIPKPPVGLPAEPEKFAPKEGLFVAVEEMPRFPGCEDLEMSTTDKTACANRKLLEYVYRHIRYPQLAKENDIEGTVVIHFVVEKDGSISNAEVLRDPGGGCGREALRVVKMMPRWTPGKQRNRAVRVQYNLPVKYRLDKD